MSEGCVFIPGCVSSFHLVPIRVTTQSVPSLATRSTYKKSSDSVLLPSKYCTHESHLDTIKRNYRVWCARNYSENHIYHRKTYLLFIPNTKDLFIHHHAYFFYQLLPPPSKPKKDVWSFIPSALSPVHTVILQCWQHEFLKHPFSSISQRKRQYSNKQIHSSSPATEAVSTDKTVQRTTWWV